MKKMTTLFVVTYHGKGLPGAISSEVRAHNAWVFSDTENVTPTVKFDGTACAIIEGVYYKRYDAKHGKTAPEGAIPCGEPDAISGHHPHWIPVTLDKAEDQYFREAWNNLPDEYRLDGTYEMCGEKVGVNAERIHQHELIKHGSVVCENLVYSFEGIRDYLAVTDVEGIVFHHKDGRMCKIRKNDFGFKRGE